jgi:hypothetical protein
VFPGHLYGPRLAVGGDDAVGLLREGGGEEIDVADIVIYYEYCADVVGDPELEAE